ncbi:MAG TPA: WD40 repeat domain-containing protein [Polyangia bacterium]|nr:WD40 repeat domain-containing protein [Polyangia bacterium]
MRGAGGWLVALLSLLGGALALPACGRALDAGAHGPDGGAPRFGATGARDADLAPSDGGAGQGDAAPGAGDGSGRTTDGGFVGGRAADGGFGGGRTADGGATDGGRTTMSVCLGSGSYGLEPSWSMARVPTALPFSCNPMPRRLIFPPAPPTDPLLPGAGNYSRCATFGLGAAQALALSTDGRFAAMVNGDGVARIIEVASQQVIALLAPPRAHVSRVAFSPDGQWVATIAGAEHELDVYSTATWTAQWTTILPGTPYGYVDGAAGAIAFSPDSQRLAVSPGANLYLTYLGGSVVSSYSSLAVLDVAYAWNGQRLVVADAFLTGSCIRRPDGGRIVVLDPSNLVKLETVATWAGYSADEVTPAFRASPTDDLVFVPASSQEENRALHAFKLSDGTELPRPTTVTLPAAFLPDGDLLLASGGTLGVQPVGGATVAKVAAPTPALPVVGVSADGSTVAVGGDGADLLRVWHPTDSFALGVCALDDLAPGPLALSGDGHAVAVGLGGDIQVVRPDDGTILGTVNGNGQPFQRLMLSPSGAYVAAAEYPPLDPVEALPSPSIDYLQIIAVASDGLVADLSKRGAFHAGYVFSSDETAFYDTWFPPGGTASGTLERVDLPTGKVTALHGVPFGTRPIGVSGGCPVLFDPARGAYRSCDSCDEQPTPGLDAVVSPDGRTLLTRDPYPALTTTLWSLGGGGMLHVFGPHASVDPSWTVDTVPVAASAGAGGVLIGAGVYESCYDGPAYPTLLEDQTGKVLATLPPGGAPASEDLGRLTFGTEIWCTP